MPACWIRLSPEYEKDSKHFRSRWIQRQLHSRAYMKKLKVIVFFQKESNPAIISKYTFYVVFNVAYEYFMQNSLS